MDENLGKHLSLDIKKEIRSRLTNYFSSQCEKNSTCLTYASRTLSMYDIFMQFLSSRKLLLLLL